MLKSIFDALGIEPIGLVLSVIGFLIFVWIMARLLMRPIDNVIKERQDDIARTYDQLDADRKGMEETRREYEQRLQNIEAEARERIQAAVKEAQALAGTMKADAQQQVESILETGRQETAREREKAFLEMRQQLVALAVSAAGKVIGESMNDARHTKLVDDFISSIGSGAVVEAGRGVSGGSNGAGGAAAG